LRRCFGTVFVPDASSQCCPRAKIAIHDVQHMLSHTEKELARHPPGAVGMTDHR
jgi:hypothetical protein